MRIVLDTDVVVRALRSPQGASAGLVEAALDDRVILLASNALALEYEAVCQRPEHGRAAGLAPAQVEAFLDGLAHIVEPVRIYYDWRGFLPEACRQGIAIVAKPGECAFRIRAVPLAPLGQQVDELTPFGGKSSGLVAALRQHGRDHVVETQALESSQAGGTPRPIQALTRVTALRKAPFRARRNMGRDPPSRLCKAE